MQLAHTRSELVLPVHGMRLYCPAGQLSLQFVHTPSYRELGEHMVPMYWLAPHPTPVGSVQGTQLLVSTVPRPVHCPTRTCRGLQDVCTQGAHCVASVDVVPSQKPIWYCPAWHPPQGTQRVVS